MELTHRLALVVVCLVAALVPSPVHAGACAG